MNNTATQHYDAMRLYVQGVIKLYNWGPSGISNRFLGEITEHQRLTSECHVERTKAWSKQCNGISLVEEQWDQEGNNDRQVKLELPWSNSWPMPFAWTHCLLLSPLLTMLHPDQLYSVIRHISHSCLSCLSKLTLHLWFLIFKCSLPDLHKQGLFLWMAMLSHQRGVSCPVYLRKAILPW